MFCLETGGQGRGSSRSHGVSPPAIWPEKWIPQIPEPLKTLETSFAILPWPGGVLSGNRRSSRSHGVSPMLLIILVTLPIMFGSSFIFAILRPKFLGPQTEPPTPSNLCSKRRVPPTRVSWPSKPPPLECRSEQSETFESAPSG